MAITVALDNKKLTASFSTDFVNTEGRATVVYNVQFDSAEYEPAQAVLLAPYASGVPEMWSSHPYDQWLFVCGKSVTNYIEAKFCFEVTVEYKSEADPLVLYDELGAGTGTLVALSESREAAMPFYPEVKPIDAYNAAILDQIQLDDTK